MAPMVPRRVLFFLLGVFVIALLLSAHPSSREQASKAAHYGLSAVASLTHGKLAGSYYNDNENATDEQGDYFDVLPSTSSVSSTVAQATASPSASSTHIDIPPAPVPTSDVDVSNDMDVSNDADESDDHELTEDEENNLAKWYKALSFLADSDLYANPAFDIDQLVRYAPHNYHGPGHETISTLLVTRHPSILDPYFLAAQQQVYRVLWDPRSKSRFSMTVFVAPFVHEDQRRLLQAAGAHVKEISILEWKPDHETLAPAIWLDQFTKLNMWKELDFSKILYLDVDAFPVDNIDALLDDMSPAQQCQPDHLPQETLMELDEICNYTFTAALDRDAALNAGMLVIKPNEAMYDYLVQGMYQNTDKYNENQVEQGYLGYVFREDGPFPAHYIDRSWNAYEPKNDDEGKVHVVHAKLWVFHEHPDHFATSYFNDTWLDMLELYQSEEFVRLRSADGLAKLV